MKTTHEGSIPVVAFRPEHLSGVVDVVLPIQQLEFGVPITLEEQPDLMDIPGYCQRDQGNFWVALAGAEVVGTIALLDLGGGLGALRKMFVKKAWRGKERGIARGLLETLLAWADGRGFREIYLGTVAGYFAAHRFYEKNGFEQISAEALPPAFPRVGVDSKFYRLVLAGQAAAENQAVPPD
jgi:GNAT superfamily N-acetyltransferase